MQKARRLGRALFRRVMQRGGRRFPEERPVFAGEPSELPEPYWVAISVTVVLPGALSRKARRARCIRRNSKYRLGLIPSCSWQHTRNVRSETPSAAQSSGI